MEDTSEVPLGKRLTIGIVFNLKTGKKYANADEEAEYDNIETINAIKDSLNACGYKVALINANEDLPTQLRKTKIDLAFNIAEGNGGRGREAQIPSILSYYRIPFSGSDETTLCLALDKALTKKLLQDDIPTPKFAEVTKNDYYGIEKLHFPVIVKPNAEGSSKGINNVSVAKNINELKVLLDNEFKMYDGSMLCEEYICGREFTVGLIGNGSKAMAFTPMELAFRHATEGEFTVYSYNVKKEYTKHIDCVCPPNLPENKIEELKTLSLKIYNLLKCKDFARADFRMDENGNVFFIEINPLPGLAPNYSDFPMLAEFCGVGYSTLIAKIITATIERLQCEGKL